MGDGNGRESRWTRREVLTRGIGMTGALLAAPAAAAAGAVDVSAKGVNFVRDRKALKGTLSMASSSYSPSLSMVKTANNPVPHHKLGTLAKKYENMHPGVKINLITVPVGTDPNYFREWVVTQMVGNTEPHVVTTQAFDANNDVDAGKNWWTNLSPYLNQGNPYISKGHPGATKWIDEFWPAPTAAKQNANGNTYVVPVDLVTTFFYYNEDMFKSAGVKPPTSFSDWIKGMKKLQKAGHLPYGGMGWSTTQLEEMITRPWEKQVKPTGAGGSYTQEDVDVAIVKGIIDPDSDRYREYLRLAKLTVPYWEKDWSVTKAGSVNELRFEQGQFAIQEDGSWEFAVLRSAKPTFKWSTFFMPPVTQGSAEGDSKYADGKRAPSIGGATSDQWGVTKKAQDDGLVPLAIDFMRYLTAPQNASIYINELGEFLPNEKEAKVVPSLQAALKGIVGNVGESGMLSYIGDWLPAEANTEVTNATNAYWLDKASLTATSKQIKEIYMTYAQQLVKQNGWTV